MRKAYTERRRSVPTRRAKAKRAKVSEHDTESIRRAALEHLWLPHRDWHQMAEVGEPLVIVEGHGIRLTDSDGNSWIDVNGGYNSVNVGYGRNEIAEAAYEQMLRTSYFAQGTTTPPAAALAAKLAEIAPGSLTRVFLVSGGSEANETALKIARAYHRRRGEPGRYRVISRKGSYHGATGGVLWLGSIQGAPRHDFEPAYPGMVYGPQPNPYRCELGGQSPSECAVRCAQAIEDLILFHGPETVAAVIAEPVSQPQGGIVPGDEYWPMLRDICDRYGVVLIADEVITGFGRTGRMFAVEHWGVVPDIMTVAKGIVSSYLPLGAAIVQEEIAEYFVGEHGVLPHVFTSTGHPVTAAAALKNIEIIERESIVDNAAEVGAYFKQQLGGLMVDHPAIGDVRGLGLLLGMELVSDRGDKARFGPDLGVPSRLNDSFRRHGLLLRSRTETLIIGPPLCITREEVDEIVHAIDLSLWELEGELGISQTV